MIRTIAIAATLFLAASIPAWAMAPRPFVTHVFLNRKPLSGIPGWTTTMLSLEWPPGANSGRHYRDGDEYALVTEGALRIVYANGRPPQTVTAGHAYHIAVGVVHETRNITVGRSYSILVLVIQHSAALSTPAR